MTWAILAVLCFIEFPLQNPASAVVFAAVLALLSPRALSRGSPG